MSSRNRGYGVTAGRPRRRSAVCITYIATGREVKVKFSQLNEGNWSELLDESSEWGRCDYSPFFEIWAEDVEWRGDVRKVVLAAEPDQRMQGILFLASEGPLWPEGCVLITAPWNRYGCDSREYTGVGTVLVAYLVEESIGRGKDGMLRFQIDPDAQLFYESLGFECVNPEMPDYYVLKQEGAKDVLRRVRCRPVEGSRTKRGSVA